MNKQQEEILCGFAEADITPLIPASCELVGFNRPDETPKGILHRLKSQVLILKSDKEDTCLITIDSIGFTTGLTDTLRDGIAKKLKLKRENVMICFSHTHSAPNAAANDGVYFYFVYDKIMRMVDEAYADLVPIKAKWGLAENNVGLNRRAGVDTMDKCMGVLKIANEKSHKTKVLLIHITAHANVLTSDNYLISADYFGITRELLEKEYGCKVMLVQGAAGNVRPRYRQHNADFLEIHPLEAAGIKMDENETRKVFEESMESLDKMAREIFKSVNSVFNRLIPEPIYRITMFSDFHCFHADVPGMDYAVKIACEAKKEEGIDGGEWLKEVKRLNDEKINVQTTKKEIQYFFINNGCICGIADEPMCEIALDIRNKADNKYIFFGGYMNGYEGYLASAEEYDKGGYEVLWSNLIYFKYFNRVMSFNRDTADRLADIIAQRCKGLLKEEIDDLS